MSGNKTFIGELNERIAIQRSVKVKSEISGQTTNTWQVLKNCWAKVEDASGTEEVEGKVVYVATKLFVIRYDERFVGPGQTSKQVLYENETFNILDVSKIGRKRYLKIKAVKRE